MQKNKKQYGQSMIESLIVISILLIVCYGSIEIMRLLAFKSVLHSITSYISHQIAYKQLSLIQKKIIPENENILLKNSIVKKNASEQINQQLASLYSSKISFGHRQKDESKVLFVQKHMTSIDIKIINSPINPNQLPAGVYINVRACLPVLFFSYFANMPSKTIIIGEKSDEKDERNCQGLYSNNLFSPLFWFKVRSAAYSPWPASSEIFRNGIGVPEEFPGLNNKTRKETTEKIFTTNLTPYFSDEVKNAL